MARLPNLKSIKPESFTELSWFPRFAALINPFMEQVYSAFNKRLTITDNMSGAILEFQTDGTYPILLTWSLPDAPKIFTVGDCYSTSGTTTITSAPYAQCTFSNGKVRVENIYGITPSASNRYTIILTCLTN